MVRKIQRIQKTPRSEWEKLIKIIYDVLTEEQKKEIIQKIKKDDVDKSFRYKILKIPKSTFYFWLKKKEKTPYKNPFEDKIIEIFYELEAKCGRQKVQKMLEIEHGITLNERTLGRILNRNGLKTKTRQQKKRREIKDVLQKTKILSKEILTVRVQISLQPMQLTLNHQKIFLIIMFTYQLGFIIKAKKLLTEIYQLLMILNLYIRISWVSQLQTLNYKRSPKLGGLF